MKVKKYEELLWPINVEEAYWKNTLAAEAEKRLKRKHV